MKESESENCSVMSNSLRPHGLYSPWNSPSNNTGVEGLSLLQVNFPTQGLNPGLPHAKMGTINDRNSMDLTEAEDIKKCQEYTEELYKKGLNDPDNHCSVVTHLEPDILEGELKWALGSIAINKASEGVGITVELFQILKDDAMKVLHSIGQQIWKIQQWPQEWKKCFDSNLREKQCQRMFKLPHNCTHFTC